MSFSEKMKFWDSRAAADDVEDDNDDGDDDERSILGWLSADINVISESRALAWLAARLRSRSLLQWETDGMEDLAVNKIRQTILAALPTGMISERRPPRQHKVSFRLGWGHIMNQFPQERTDPLQAIAITACSGKVQVTSVKEYIYQTWPWSGNSLFDLLQRIASIKQHSLDSRGEESPSSDGKPGFPHS